MKLLVTGSEGFIGKNLIEELKSKKLYDICEFDIETNPDLLDDYCSKTDFVFHMAGINRPKEQSQFMEGNFGFTSKLLATLRKHKNNCPVMISSSSQAELDNPYGESKKAGESLLFTYGEETGAKVLVYRFPNVFGKWCKPNYNSAVATFCHNFAHNLPIQVNDPSVIMNLVYIDDVIAELINALDGKENKVDEFCEVPIVHTITLGEIVDLIHEFKRSREERAVPNMSDDFTKKLYSTYLSYLPKNQFRYELKMNVDHRGSFTEFLRTPDRGQLSVNISKPGITKGNHWHHTKNEKFLVVSGKGVIRFRAIHSDEVIEYFVKGDKLEVVDIPTGYTHNIENLGDEDMVTIMWVNEPFDPTKPDTYSWRYKMKPLKIMTVVGTRPEIIRLSAVISKLEDSDAIDHILVHTGQNYDYELNEVFFQDFKLEKPDFFLNAATGTAVETIGNILVKIDPILEEVKPDAFLVLGDTNSCLCAIAAKRRHIPIFHMEAGNRCFDQRVPEETNRKIVDHISDINLTYSDIAREYLLREGLPADRIIKTGSPMFEVLHSRKEDIANSDVLNRLGLEEGKYFVVSAHREENINSEKNFVDLVNSLNSVAEKYQLPMIVSTHPRTRNMIKQKGIKFNSFIQTMKPLGFNDYNKLQMNSKAVLSDSGTISEESSILGFRALNIRQAHERPEAMEEASVMMVGLKEERIMQGLEILETQEKDTLRYVADYSMPNVSDKVLRIILSYTDYVNRVVWGR